MKSEKIEIACLKNGLPKMPQLGQAWYRSRQKLSREYLVVFCLSHCKTSVDTSHTTENGPFNVSKEIVIWNESGNVEGTNPGRNFWTSNLKCEASRPCARAPRAAPASECRSPCRTCCLQRSVCRKGQSNHHPRPAPDLRLDDAYFSATRIGTTQRSIWGYA